MVKTSVTFAMMASALLASLSGNVLGAPEETFAERRQRAELVEAQSSVRSYLDDKMFPAVGPAIATAMHDCLKPKGASMKRFTILADLSKDGHFTRVAYEPKTNTATCFAAAMAAFHAPPPPTQDGNPLPIVIDMKVAP